MSRNAIQKRPQAFRMRLTRDSFSDISKALKVSTATLIKWENGWIDSKGRRHRGWKEELARLWKEQEEKELQCGLMLKKERLKTYDKLARMVIEKIEKQFPSITTKTSSDMKALLSEVRELCRLIAIEKGEYPSGSQTLVAVKTDISLPELQERYKDVQHNSEEEAD